MDAYQRRLRPDLLKWQGRYEAMASASHQEPAYPLARTRRVGDIRETMGRRSDKCGMRCGMSLSIPEFRIQLITPSLSSSKPWESAR